MPLLGCWYCFSIFLHDFQSSSSSRRHTSEAFDELNVIMNIHIKHITFSAWTYCVELAKISRPFLELSLLMPLNSMELLYIYQKKTAGLVPYNLWQTDEWVYLKLCGECFIITIYHQLYSFSTSQLCNYYSHSTTSWVLAVKVHQFYWNNRVWLTMVVCICKWINFI